MINVIKKKEKNVKIYSTPFCGFCKLAKDYFNSKNIEYTEYDVSQDTAKREEAVKKSGFMGVPIIDIEGKIIVGFDQEAIDKALTE